MINYKEGAVVVCVEPGEPVPNLTLNGLYTVKRMLDTGCFCGSMCGSTIGVWLEEFPSDPLPWCSHTFRLAYHPDLSVTLERTTPVPVPTKQDA